MPAITPYVIYLWHVIADDVCYACDALTSAMLSTSYMGDSIGRKFLPPSSHSFSELAENVFVQNDADHLKRSFYEDAASENDTETRSR